MTDNVAVAKRLWLNVEDGKWSFAEAAYSLKRGEVKLLADAIGRSSDTVESYRAGWDLYTTAAQCDPPLAGHCREDLSISHFIAVAKVWRREEFPVPTEDALDLLAEARAECWSVEDLRRKLPSMSGGDWWRSAKKLSAALDRQLVNAPRLGVDERGAAKVARACRLVIGRIDRMKESAE